MSIKMEGHQRVTSDRRSIAQVKFNLVLAINDSCSTISIERVLLHLRIGFYRDVVNGERRWGNDQTAVQGTAPREAPLVFSSERKYMFAAAGVLSCVGTRSYRERRKGGNVLALLQGQRVICGIDIAVHASYSGSQRRNASDVLSCPAEYAGRTTCVVRHSFRDDHPSVVFAVNAQRQQENRFGTREGQRARSQARPSQGLSSQAKPHLWLELAWASGLRFPKPGQARQARAAFSCHEAWNSTLRRSRLKPWPKPGPGQARPDFLAWAWA
ncbi:hypothetical protein DFH07DRAFT_769300 [Mycena maculata]|uniref:Uncharacterized protein n=1 Tax=Mycena maculata TaxID=230809 RepID=A0AAD7NNX5_9AGAR|nr:hypothetical protein DFH07DRAFT_769300 [Mycena maculata]